MDSSCPRVGYVTRVELFSSAHRLYSSHFDDEGNRDLYGKCCHPSGHGHNYKLEVTLKGPIDIRTGMVMNLARLKVLIKNHVLDLLDHRNLDKDVEFFKTNPSTVENISIFVWTQLQPELGSLLYKVKVHETDKNSAAYKG